MRALIAVAVLVLGAGAAEAGGAPRGLYGRGAFVERYSGTPVSVPTRLQPVVGSVAPKHTSHLTGKTKYQSAVYNPVLGSFGKYTFRR